MGKVWLIASGKGGVGKSMLASSLGMALSCRGEKICIVDGDIGLRDQDVILGLSDRIVYDMIDVCRGDCSLSQALVQSPDYPGLTLLPAAQFARSKDLDVKAFRLLTIQLKQRFDHVLIDAPAGIERGLRSLLKGALDEILIVCTPDDVCIRNADRTVGLLHAKGMPVPQLVVNRLNDALIRSGEMYSAQTVAQTLDIPLIGEIPEDQCVYRALLSHTPLMQLDCAAGAALSRIACRLSGDSIPLPGIGTRRLPWYKRLAAGMRKEKANA